MRRAEEFCDFRCMQQAVTSTVRHHVGEGQCSDGVRDGLGDAVSLMFLGLMVYHFYFRLGASALMSKVTLMRCMRSDAPMDY